VIYYIGHGHVEDILDTIPLFQEMDYKEKWPLIKALTDAVSMEIEKRINARLALSNDEVTK
jgi:cell fate (sporulation/competence/biofilm development) regulator YmcA (YheA/YmcA/DUF963 family)